ncbi:hypothetical protein OG943_34415 [Amycolatopsis sp. NBC_00345]|uniref:hypothetical protein n=1 Tax=Amycolatopsis sp. NBC_00345 TaxID=2975955 RepID=UPI002E26A4B0
MARWISLAVGVILVLVGAVWVLQGAGVVTGSFMTGQKLWFLIGLVAFLVGVVVVAATTRRSSSKTRPNTKPEQTPETTD